MASADEQKLLLSSLIIITSSQAMYSVAVCFRTRVTTKFFFLSLFLFSYLWLRVEQNGFGRLNLAKNYKKTRPTAKSYCTRQPRPNTDLLRDQIPYRKSRLTFSGVRRDRFICFILGWSFFPIMVIISEPVHSYLYFVSKTPFLGNAIL